MAAGVYGRAYCAVIQELARRLAGRDEPQRRGGVGEDTHHVGATPNLPAEPLQGVGQVNLPPVLRRTGNVGQHVTGSLEQPLWGSPLTGSGARLLCELATQELAYPVDDRVGGS